MNDKPVCKPQPSSHLCPPVLTVEPAPGLNSVKGSKGEKVENAKQRGGSKPYFCPMASKAPFEAYQSVRSPSRGKHQWKCSRVQMTHDVAMQGSGRLCSTLEHCGAGQAHGNCDAQTHITAALGSSEIGDPRDLGRTSVPSPWPYCNGSEHGQGVKLWTGNQIATLRWPGEVGASIPCSAEAVCLLL